MSTGRDAAAWPTLKRGARIRILIRLDPQGEVDLLTEVSFRTFAQIGSGWMLLGQFLWSQTRFRHHHCCSNAFNKGTHLRHRDSPENKRCQHTSGTGSGPAAPPSQTGWGAWSGRTGRPAANSCLTQTQKANMVRVY